MGKQMKVLCKKYSIAGYKGFCTRGHLGIFKAIGMTGFGNILFTEC